jgi:hypothetical protein
MTMHGSDLVEELSVPAETSLPSDIRRTVVAAMTDALVAEYLARQGEP